MAVGVDVGQSRAQADTVYVILCPGADTGRFRIVDVWAARVPGVRAILTGNDLPDRRVGRRLRDLPVLARDRVLFVGEKVAAVAAEDSQAAEEALLLIDVEYEELPAVFDPFEATQGGRTYGPRVL